MRVVDPFSFFVGHSSLIPGLGGPDPASDLRYCFHTDYLDAAPGRAVFHATIRCARATFGELNIRVMALPPGRDASVAASIRVDLDNLGGEDLARSLRFLAVEGVRYALYAFATGASDLQADGLDIALEELVTPTAHARPAPHAGGNTADRARSDPAATTTARRLIADKGPSLDLPFSQPMQWDPEAERMLRGRWPLLDKRGGNALDCWSSGTALQMLDFGGLIADGNKGLIVDLAEAALLGTLEAAGCAIHLLTLDREDVDLLALDRAEGLCDFAIAAVPAQWQGAGRLETFCERMMQCLAKDGFLIMMINMTGDGEALAFRNRMQQLALYCIGLGHDVMQLAFPAGDSWHPPGRCHQSIYLDCPKVNKTGEMRRSFIDAWLTQQAVIKALILREMQARYGRDNIGFLWMMAEPMMLASVITTLHQVSKMGEHASGMGPYPFTLTGYCVFIIFRNSFNRSEGALHGVTTLLYHAQITPFDIMLSRSLVEMIGALFAYAVLCSIGLMLGLMELPVRPLYLFGAIIGMGVMTHAMCMVVAAITYTNHLIGRFVHPFSYFMFPLSGAFFTMSILPPWARELMAWNPMVTIFEAARYGLFANANPNYIYPRYVLGFTMLMLCWGLVAIRNVREHMHVN